MEKTEPVTSDMAINNVPLVTAKTSPPCGNEVLQSVLRLIEKSAWDELIKTIHENPTLAYSSLTGASALYSGSQGNLAIHEVCKCQPTVEVIEALISANPESVKTKGQWGYLPLHYACTSGASHLVVEMIIEAHPEAVRTRDDHEEILPLHLACKWGASEAVLLSIMTVQPEGVYLCDRAGKSPQDYAESLPAGTIKKQVLKTLELGPIMCAVSKAAQRRTIMETENRLKGMAEAHTGHVQQWEHRYQNERLEYKELAKSLRAQLVTAEMESKEAEKMWRPRVEIAKSHLAEVTSTLEATKDALSFTLQCKEEVQANLLMANDDIEKKQARIAELEGLVSSQSGTITGLENRLEIHVQAEQVLAESVVDLQQSLKECENDLNDARSEVEITRVENSRLIQDLALAHSRVDATTCRLESIQKWVHSISESMDTWSMENDPSMKYPELDNLLKSSITASLSDGSDLKTFKSAETSEETEDDSSTIDACIVDDTVGNLVDVVPPSHLGN